MTVAASDGDSKPLGQHVLADLSGLAADQLTDASAWLSQCTIAAERAGARVVQRHVHRFGGGGGIAGVLVLAESHLSFHTWPEFGFAAIDCFMCGDADPGVAIDGLLEWLKPQAITLVRQPRGPNRVGSVPELVTAESAG